MTFHLEAQLAAAGDSTKDPTQPWPDDRKVVDLGVLTIDKAVADSAAAEKSLLFLPGQLTDGIEPSDDPLIDVRDAALWYRSRAAILERAQVARMSQGVRPEVAGPIDRLRESRVGVQTCRLLPDFTSFIRATNCPPWMESAFPFEHHEFAAAPDEQRRRQAIGPGGEFGRQRAQPRYTGPGCASR